MGSSGSSTCSSSWLKVFDFRQFSSELPWLFVKSFWWRLLLSPWAKLIARHWGTLTLHGVPCQVKAMDGESMVKEACMAEHHGTCLVVTSSLTWTCAVLK